MSSNNEFIPSDFARNADWDMSHIEATARLGVCEVDVEKIHAMGFGEAEVAELLAHCRALVGANSDIIRFGSFGPIVYTSDGKTRMATQEDLDTLEVGEDLSEEEEQAIEE